jgi:hypothetical protein
VKSETVGLLLIVLIVAVPVAYLRWRFTRNDAPEAGGSFGKQLFRRKKDDWGPKS